MYSLLITDIFLFLTNCQKSQLVLIYKYKFFYKILDVYDTIKT